VLTSTEKRRQWMRSPTTARCLVDHRHDQLHDLTTTNRSNRVAWTDTRFLVKKLLERAKRPVGASLSAVRLSVATIPVRDFGGRDKASRKLGFPRFSWHQV
jgi:hypothetical protein